MKRRIGNLLKNELFLILFNGVVAYTAFSAVILATLGVPHEVVLDSGLQEILLVFEG